MLRELKQVRQHKDEPRRRWFNDDYFDLIVWFSEKDSISGGNLDVQRVAEKFRAESKKIDTNIAQLVYEKLLGFNG